MAPKKKQDDQADRPPEGDDERLVTISLAAQVDRAFFAKLKSPMIVVALSSAPEEAVRTEIPQEALQSRGEGDEQRTMLQLTVFAKKVTITPQFVENVLGGRPTVSLYSIPEQKDPPPLAPGAKATKAPAAAGKGKAPSSVLEMSLDDLALQFTFSFDFCLCFSKKEASLDLGLLTPIETLQGVEEGVLRLVCSDPLLAPANMARYMPVVVEVTRVTNLPSDGPIALEHNGLRPSTLKRSTSGSDDSDGEVYVEYELLGEVVRTQTLRRTADVTFAHRKAFFLSKYNRLDLMQKLFYPFEFQVHDQEHVKSKLRPSFGAASISLRTALTDQVKLFTLSSQLLPGREGNEGTLPPPDYLSFGSTLKTKIEFLVSPERPRYVAAATGDDTPGDPLSRVILTMPYQGPVVSPALQAIMGTLVNMAKGGVDSSVKEATEPQPDAKKQQGTPASAVSPPSTKGFRLYCPNGITGFEVMDDSSRMLCFEGPIRLVHKLAEVATSVVGDDPSCAVRINAELQFPQRAYHIWPSLVHAMETKPKESVPAAEGKVTPTPGAASGKKPAGGAKKKAEAEAPKPPPPEMEDAPPEIDAGGVGGRIRRIRLGTPVDKLASTQRNFIKRTLPLDALTCITKLGCLRRAPSVMHAVDMNVFPSAHELIALERVHGQTLELVDVCGTDEFVSFSDADVTSIVQKAKTDASNALIAKPREVDVTALEPTDMGLVVSFEGVPASGQQRQGMVFDACTFSRLRHKAFIFLLAQQQTIACAFASEPPTQMLRHSFTAQVVNSGGTPVLFVIDFHSLAKNSSDHLNLAFDAKLRRDKRRAPAKEYFSQLAARNAHYTRTHRLAQSGQYRDNSSDDEDGFVDGPPDVATGLEQAELIPNYVVLNKTVPPGPSTAEEAVDYDLARALYAKQSRRLEARSDPDAFEAAVPFRTTIQRTAEDDRQHPMAPSQQRVDDLKQPWEAPKGYKGTKVGPNPFRFNGARDVLEDPSRSKSMFGGMTAEMRKLEEDEERRKTIGQWKEKVVVNDTSFSVRCKVPTDAPVSQLDKLQSILDEAPLKRSLQKTFVPSAPPSIFTHEVTPRLVRVEPTQKKHPECQRFYYSTEPPKPMVKKDITNGERLSPLYYRQQNSS